MGFEVVFNHTFKFPLHHVIRTHFAKYPCDDMDVMGVRTEKYYYDPERCVHYWRRVMICRNLLPRILRRIKALDCDEVLLEEECWYHKQGEVMEIRSRNLTWRQYAQAWEESQFKRSKESRQWTVLHQRGGLDVKVFGSFGRIVELFLHGLAKRNGLRAIKHMDNLLVQKQPQGDGLDGIMIL